MAEADTYGFSCQATGILSTRSSSKPWYSLALIELMMRLFRIVLFVASLLAAATLSTVNWGQQQAPLNTKRENPQGAQKPPTTDTSENHHPAARQYDSTDEKLYQWPPPWWSPFWSNWAIVLVGLGAAVVALRTLSQISEQAVQTRNAADAATLNAQAIINFERPWITIRAECIGFRITVAAVNEGRTPAEVTLHVGKQCVILAEESLPVQPIYPTGSSLDESILSPSSPPVCVFLCEVDIWNSDELLEAINSGQKALFIMGHILYRSTLHKARVDLPTRLAGASDICRDIRSKIPWDN
jgi:hypothetical protein